MEFIIDQCNGDASEQYIDAFESAWRESDFSIVIFANFWLGQ